MSAEELEQTAAHSEDSLDEASLEVDPETPSTKNRKYVKVGIAVAAFAAIGLGIGIGFETGKDGNAQSNSSMSASMNGWSGSDGSYKCDDEHAYGYGGKVSARYIRLGLPSNPRPLRLPDATLPQSNFYF